MFGAFPPGGCFGAQKPGFHQIPPTFMKIGDFHPQSCTLHDFSQSGGGNRGIWCKPWFGLPFTTVKHSRNLHFRSPRGGKMWLCVPKSFSREKSSWRAKFSFTGNIHLPKSEFLWKFHWFDIGIYNVLWILRIWVIPSRENGHLRGNSWNSCCIHENHITSQLFMHFH